jgi:hypothetical protein
LGLAASRNTTEGPVNWVNKVAAQPAHAADHAIEDFCEAGFAVVAVWFTIRFTAAAAWRLMRQPLGGSSRAISMIG